MPVPLDESSRLPNDTAGEARRVVLASPVHEVVRLVDDQDGVLDRALRSEVEKGDRRVEDVVVVADHSAGFAQEFERNLEGAHLGGVGHLEHPVGVEVGRTGEKRGQHSAVRELAAVVARVEAELLVANHLAVGTHLCLRSELDRAPPAALHRLKRLDR